MEYLTGGPIVAEKTAPQLAREDYWRTKLQDLTGQLDGIGIEQVVVELLVEAYEEGFSDGWVARV